MTFAKPGVFNGMPPASLAAVSAAGKPKVRCCCVMLRCGVSVFCSVLQCVAAISMGCHLPLSTVSAAGNPKACCCSVVLQCVAVCCRVFNGMPPASLAISMGCHLPLSTVSAV